MTTLKKPSQTITSETIDTLNRRVSIREFSEDPLYDDTVVTILNAARRTSTSSNTQSYSFVVVRDPQSKQKLAHLAGNQQYIETCPVFVAVCADLYRLAHAAQMHGADLAINLELSMVAIVDAAIAGQSAALAAESLGLGTVMIGGMRNHPHEVAEVLGLPRGVFVVYGLCMGWYETRPPARKPRLPEESVIHFEHYLPVDHATLTDYDQQLAAHYRKEGRKTSDAAWTEVIAQKFGKFNREHLRGFLEDWGYVLD
ncbi:MAG: NADPH-dependent oxidoreductase [Anaerolineae bacterium]|jgi:nitroreductase|nr:NADPH-dependent oxidoreductase [Anaerolineae bacterium]